MIASAHIVAGQALGGAELFYVRLVNALQEQRQPVLAINSPGGGVSAKLQAEVKQLHVPMRAIWDLPSRWRIGTILRERQPDIVQTYMGRATRLTHLNLNRRPIHVARLGGYYDLKGYRHAHAWVGNTQGICDYLVRNGLPASRIAYIGNFVDIPDVSLPEQLADLRRQLAIPEHCDKDTLTQIVYEAHRTLSELNPANRETFQGVLDNLRLKLGGGS